MNDRFERDQLEKALADFKEIVRAETADLNVDERMVASVRAGIDKQPRRGFSGVLVVGLAAACLLVMLVSGSLLFPGLIAANRQPQERNLRMSVATQTVSSPKPMSLSAQQLSYSQDGTPLPYSIAEAQDYCEGYAVALASNGLYGFIDEDGRWAVGAIYEQASPVSSGCAEVTLNGRKTTLVLP